MRLAVVEGDPRVLERLTLALHGESGIEVVGSFGSGEAALQALEACRPDAVLVDLKLPGMSGIELIVQVRARQPEVDLVAHAALDDPATILAAIRAGACGYLLESSPLADVIAALRTLSTGGAPLSPRIARLLVRELQAPTAAPARELVSPRERDVLREIERGHSYLLIGERLGISPHTVNAHVKNAYRKLRARDRWQALETARRKGIL